ncbi:ribosomal protein L7/L12 [Crossiella sp. SN42]|uniref:ribosomal protein L7/L12 n=1 Tax=Crossiella sp. SN42 TaxID=2944808 RepID=UPI00207CAE10|nr:ribosomal protein L7/L12 [Crossiella sp. SN42]MCO1577703.1 ribosomal protein L7/L12 [Crossiella sp. SN42]
MLILLPFLLVIAVLGLSGSSSEARARRLERRLVDVEAKLDALLAHHGVSLPEPEFPAVRALALGGRKIEAIKRYREQTGAGLKEAKDAVERMTDV